ncbi:MAG: tetratricopeptide repeat protein [Prevotellaceae bacterium]|nr:tetratricopeptide repeat protein [Prevotellaceae bacterium]
MFRTKKHLFPRRFATSRLLATLLALSLAVPAVLAQTADWRTVRRGNRHFVQGRYPDAEAEYLKARKLNARDARVQFNLGDVYLAQGNQEAAVKQFDAVVRSGESKAVKAKAFHNLGYISQTAALQQTDEAKKQEGLKEAIEHYKNALRNNPLDDGTRYNLALCQKLLKDSQNKQPQSEPQQQPDSQGKQNQPQQNRPDREPQSDHQPNPQTRQLMNLSRQSEKRTQQKINAAQQRSQRSSGKNW